MSIDIGVRGRSELWSQSEPRMDSVMKPPFDSSPIKLEMRSLRGRLLSLKELCVDVIARTTFPTVEEAPVEVRELVAWRRAWILLG